MILKHPAISGYFYGNPILTTEILDCLARSAGKKLSNITHIKIIKKDSFAIHQGESPNIFVLLKGQAQYVFFNQINQKKMTSLVCENELIGLAETITNTDFLISLKTITKCRFNFIKRSDFISLIDNKPDIIFEILQTLSKDKTQKYRTFCSTKF
jgi:hypothetical protein